MKDSTFESVMVYTKAFYDAAFIDQRGPLQAAERITILSSHPITITPLSLDALMDSAAEKGAEETPWSKTVRDMLKAGGMVHALKVESESPLYRVDGQIKPDARTVESSEYASPMWIISKHDHAGDLSDWLPVDVFRRFANKTEQLTTEAKSAEDLLNAAMKRIERAAENELEFGRDEDTSNMVRLASTMVQKMKDKATKDKVMDLGSTLLSKLGLGDKAGSTPESALDGNQARYYPAKITQFVNAALATATRPWAEVGGKINLIHLDDPVWHDGMDDEELKAQGYVGYWEYKIVSVGTLHSVEQLNAKQSAVMIEFTGYENLRVGVKRASDISPKGETAVPDAVWDAMSRGDRPHPQAMTSAEAEVFDKEHMLRADMDDTTSRVTN